MPPLLRLLILATVAAAAYVGAAVLINRWNLFAVPVAVVAGGLTRDVGVSFDEIRRMWNED